MAIFTAGPLVGGISGNVGGVSFANPRGSKVIRKSRRRSPNRTQAQAEKQTTLMNMIHFWQSMATEDRAAWNSAASQLTFPNRLGLARQITGYNYYLQQNLGGGMAVVGGVLEPNTTLLPPFISAQTTAQVTFVSTVAAGIIVTFDGLTGAGAYGGFFYGNLLYRNTPIKFEKNHLLLGSLSRAGDGTIDLSVAWQTQFTLPILGQYIALRFKPLSGKAVKGAETVVIIETTA